MNGANGYDTAGGTILFQAPGYRDGSTSTGIASYVDSHAGLGERRPLPVHQHQFVDRQSTEQFSPLLRLHGATCPRIAAKQSDNMFSLYPLRLAAGSIIGFSHMQSQDDLMPLAERERLVTKITRQAEMSGR